MDSTTMLKKLDRIEDLPTLPTIAMEVNSMVRDSNTSIKDLAGLLEKDQAIVPRILKLVNSAFFGFRSKISNIPRAIVVLGFNAIRNVVISVSVLDAFPGKKASEGFDITKFWTHSVTVAITSKHLAEMTRLRPPEDAFTGGLMHDIGKVVLFQYFQDFFKKVCVSMRENKLSFFDAEKKEGAITHARIGGYLAKKWQFPAGLVDTIKYHHVVNKNATDLDLLMIVHVANIIVNSFVKDSRSDLDYSAIYPDAVSVMKDQLDTSPNWFPEIYEEIKDACRFFLDDK